jgi:hypothetical protein
MIFLEFADSVELNDAIADDAEAVTDDVDDELDDDVSTIINLLYYNTRMFIIYNKRTTERPNDRPTERPNDMKTI